MLKSRKSARTLDWVKDKALGTGSRWGWGMIWEDSSPGMQIRIDVRNRTDGGQEGGSRQYSVPEAKGSERKG